MFIARKGDTTTLGAKGPVNLKNPSPLNPHAAGVSKGVSRPPAFSQ